MFVSDGCLKCKDYTSELADISVGDAWGYEKSSVAIIRTALGEELMDQLGRSDKINQKDITPEQFFEMHGHNIKHKKSGDSKIRTIIRKSLKRYGKYIPFKLLGFLAMARRKIK